MRRIRGWPTALLAAGTGAWDGPWPLLPGARPATA